MDLAGLGSIRLFAHQRSRVRIAVRRGFLFCVIERNRDIVELDDLQIVGQIQHVLLILASGRTGLVRAFLPVGHLFQVGKGALHVGPGRILRKAVLAATFKWGFGAVGSLFGFAPGTRGRCQDDLAVKDLDQAAGFEFLDALTENVPEDAQ